MQTNMNTRVWQDAMSATDDCLDLAVLERFAEPGTVVQDAKAAQHLAQCPHCQTELAMLKRFEAAEPHENEGAAVAWIAARLQRNGLDPVTSSTPMRRVSIWQSLFSLGTAWKPVAVALALVFVFGAGYLVVNRSEQPVINVPQAGGNFRSDTVKLAGPSGDLHQVPTELKWEAFQGAGSYSVELLEVDGTVLAKTNTSSTQLTLRPEQQKLMKPGKPIQWQVTALDPAGNEIANSTSRDQFRVVK